MRCCPCRNRHNCLLSGKWHIIVQRIGRKVRMDGGSALRDVCSEAIGSLQRVDFQALRLQAWICFLGVNQVRYFCMTL
jgi:hypothetical protein